jgi:DegV family protein with EDD domain
MPCVIAVVTDSSAALPAGSVTDAGLTVVPLTVVTDGVPGREGIEVSPGDVAHALAARGVAVTTSRPSPAQFAEVYGRLLAEGAQGIVSIHLSAKLSGTYDAAVLAASAHPGLVQVVDSRSGGMGLGFPVLAAAGLLGLGQPTDLLAARDAARAAIDRTSALFYVETLEYLRRGGRIGAASALLGTALSVKPILHMARGEIVVRDKVRTASRALTRLVDLAVEAAGESEVDIGVHHLAAADRAAEVVDRLTERLGGKIHGWYQSEIGAAVGAHVGPGLACIVIHTRPA